MSEIAVARDNDERARRNVRLALIHAAIALGFLALFVWSQLRGAS